MAEPQGSTPESQAHPWQFSKKKLLLHDKQKKYASFWAAEALLVCSPQTHCMALLLLVYVTSYQSLVRLWNNVSGHLEVNEKNISADP